MDKTSNKDLRGFGDFLSEWKILESIVCRKLSSGSWAAFIPSCRGDVPQPNSAVLSSSWKLVHTIFFSEKEESTGMSMNPLSSSKADWWWHTASVGLSRDWSCRLWLGISPEQQLEAGMLMHTVGYCQSNSFIGCLVTSYKKRLPITKTEGALYWDLFIGVLVAFLPCSHRWLLDASFGLTHLSPNS